MLCEDSAWPSSFHLFQVIANQMNASCAEGLVFVETGYASGP